MQMSRVVITGRGAVSPFGLGVSDFIENIWAGRSAVCKMTGWQAVKGLGSLIAAPVPAFDAKSLIPRASRRTMGPMAQYATLAAQEAIADAKLPDDFISSGDIGVSIGSTTGSAFAFEEFYSKYLPEKAMDNIKSGEFFKLMGHSCAANLSLTLGIKGENWAPVSACTSSSQAIGLGYLLIQTGRQKAMLCGGADEVHPSVTGVFDLLGAASVNNENPEAACRPFDTDRDGVVCGGGSGVLVLESYEHAVARGAKIYAEVIGFGNVNDSGHIANPDKKSMAKAMQKAMFEAQVESLEIDYVNAHATGTELGDIAEAQAICEAVDGDTPVSSFKGHIGHTLGAAGSLELIGVLEMLERQQLIPTRNLSKVDPRCNIAMISCLEKELRLNTVLKNNFALGGVNTSLVLRRVTG